MRFIQFQCANNDAHVYLPVSQIKSVCEDPEDKTAFIETETDCDGEGIGFYTKEAYTTIIAKIRLALE